MSIYFIACGGFIKVGYSEDPERRCRRLFSSTSAYTAPRAAYEARGSQVLLGHIEGGKPDERRLHAAIEDYYAGCEWFIDEPELREYLVALTDGTDATFPRLPRAAGSAWKQIPLSEQGGGNHVLAEQIIAKRRRSA